MWIVPCDLVFNKNLLKSVLAGPVNSARDPQKKRPNAPTFIFQCNPNSTLIFMWDFFFFFLNWPVVDENDFLTFPKANLHLRTPVSRVVQGPVGTDPPAVVNRTRRSNWLLLRLATNFILQNPSWVGRISNLLLSNSRDPIWLTLLFFRW